MWDMVSSLVPMEGNESSNLQGLREDIGAT